MRIGSHSSYPTDPFGGAPSSGPKTPKEALDYVASYLNLNKLQDCKGILQYMLKTFNLSEPVKEKVNELMNSLTKTDPYQKHICLRLIGEIDRMLS